MKAYNHIAILQFITGIGIIAFWIIFLSSDILYPDNMSDCYLNHEYSFPIADIIMCISLIVSAFMIFKKKNIGIKLSLISSGAMIFLGILDTTYNIQNGLYFSSLFDGIFSAFINLWLIIIGIYIVIKLK